VGGSSVYRSSFALCRIFPSFVTGLRVRKSGAQVTASDRQTNWLTALTWEAMFKQTRSLITGEKPLQTAEVQKDLRRALDDFQRLFNTSPETQITSDITKDTNGLLFEMENNDNTAASFVNSSKVTDASDSAAQTAQRAASR